MGAVLAKKSASKKLTLEDVARQAADATTAAELAPDLDPKVISFSLLVHRSLCSSSTAEQQAQSEKPQLPHSLLFSADSFMYKDKLCILVERQQQFSNLSESEESHEESESNNNSNNNSNSSGAVVTYSRQESNASTESVASVARSISFEGSSYTRISLPTFFHVAKLLSLLRTALENGSQLDTTTRNIEKMYDQECQICFESKVEIALPCSHAFCQDCVNKWKAREKKNNDATTDNAITTATSCMLCRTKNEENNDNDDENGSNNWQLETWSQIDVLETVDEIEGLLTSALNDERNQIGESSGTPEGIYERGAFLLYNICLI
jgi:hypothetical protein